MKKTHKKGVSLIEILLAVFIISIGITGATSLALGGQESIRDAGLSQSALYKVDEGLEQAFATLKGDWTGLAASAVASDGIYTKNVDVFDVSECMKQITSSAAWDVPQRSLLSSMSGLFTDPEQVRALGGNCNTTPPTGDWDFPQSYGTGSVSPAGAQATDVDVIQRGSQRIAFLATSHSAAGTHDFWVFDVTDATNPSLISSINIGAATGGRGNVNALVASGNYVYLALDQGTNQFVVVDASVLATPYVVSIASLSGVDSGGTAPEAVAIDYFDNYVYVGTERTAGPELHVFDATNPASPIELIYGGGVPLEVNHNVHQIDVQGTNVFVASSADGCELFVVDASDPTSVSNPCPSSPPAGNWIYNAAGTEDGTSITVLGTRAYLGRESTNAAGEDELYVLDISDLTNITSVGSIDLGLSPSWAQVNDVSVSGPLLFVATSDSNEEFQVWLMDLPNIIPPSSCANTFNFPEMATGVDFVDNLGFVSVRSNDALNVIFDDPSCVPVP